MQQVFEIIVFAALMLGVVYEDMLAAWEQKVFARIKKDRRAATRTAKQRDSQILFFSIHKTNKIVNRSKKI